jgi:Skp family chaperone for outer membrane proteins
MIMKIKLFIAAILAGAFISNARALEIPLTGAGSDGGVAKIGYVDMERIFQVYPQTKAAKDDYRKRLDKLKADLAARESELGNIRDRISVLDSTLKGVGTSPTTEVSTITAGSPMDLAKQPDNLDVMRNDLKTKEVEFEEARKRALEDLASFESRQSQVILGKIYEALVDLAEEEQVTLIVDKSSILFGSASTDLTEKLQERIRGF